MEKGKRSIRSNQKSKVPYSFNTEIWLSDFFWPFFSNHSYEEISKAILDVLIEAEIPSSLNTAIPVQVMNIFGDLCFENKLTNKEGVFHDPHTLVEAFCGKPLFKQKVISKKALKKKSIKKKVIKKK